MDSCTERNISRSNRTSLLSGARLSAGGLHLGHYVGCFLPIGKLREPLNALYFVILDRYSTPFGASIHTSQTLAEMMADVLAIQCPVQIIIGLGSQLEKLIHPVADVFAHFVTLRQLENVYPARRWLKRRERNPRMSEFLFPLEIAATYTLLNCKYLLANDDARRFVSFAGSLFRKVRNVYDQFPGMPPQLLHGPVPRLFGWNYRKMSKGNNNAIYISDSDDVIQRKIDQLFSYKQLQLAFPCAIKLTGARFEVPPQFAPNWFLRAFFPNRLDLLEQCRDSRNHLEIKSILLTKLIDTVRPIRERRTKLIRELTYLSEQLQEGTRLMLEVAEENFKRVMRSFE